MDDKPAPSDDMLQEFVDGQLNERDHARVAEYLLFDSEAAKRVRQMRQLNGQLKALGETMAGEPVPDRLKELIRRSQSSDDQAE